MNLKKEFESMTRNNLLRNYEIDLEFSKLSKPKKSNLEISQSDLNSNIIRLNLLMNNNPIILDESYVIYANIKKPTGEVNPNYCEIYDARNGSILLKIQPQYVDIDGSCSFEIIVVTGDGVKVVSPEVNFVVTQSLDYFLGEPDLEDISNLDFLVKTVAGLKENVISTNQNIETAEQTRNANEESREASEISRKENENIRENKFQQIETEFEEIKILSNENINSLKNVSTKYDIELETIKEQHQERVEKFDNDIISFYESSKLSENIRESNETYRISNEQNRNLDEEERKTNEAKRKSEEEKRKQFFDTVNISEKNRETNEMLRQQQEENRINSFSNIETTFEEKVTVVDSKISQITNKITEANNKITQFSSDEETRKREHSDRVNEFDTVIKTSHSEMIISEQNRKAQEDIRNTSENERQIYFNQIKIEEEKREQAEIEREKTIKVLEQSIDSKINEYNTATLITTAEIDSIIANALK